MSFNNIFYLISYQGYVNQYEVTMNNQFLYGLMASAGSAAVLALYVFFVGVRNEQCK